MNAREEFEAMVEAVRTDKIKLEPTNDEKLKAYGLYRQAMGGDVRGKKPGILDPVGRFKHESWEQCSGLPAEEAMNRYVALFRSIADRSAGGADGTASVFCPRCGEKFQLETKYLGRFAGVVSGAIAGAQAGGSVGIAAGPLGAVAGTVPGAVGGAIVGGVAGKKLGDDPECPKCGTRFSFS